jgi:hypothetical protein
VPYHLATPQYFSGFCGVMFADFAGCPPTRPPNLTAYQAVVFTASRSAASSLAGATRFCKAGNVVWFNPDSKIYFAPGSQFYGKTKSGGYTCRAFADNEGYRATKGTSTREPLPTRGVTALLWAEDQTMTTPEEPRRSPTDSLRQYLADLLLAAVERRPRLRKHLLELTCKVADKLVDDGQARRAAHLRTTSGGLKAHLPRDATCSISLKDAPGTADQQLIGDLIRWWMKHDPLGASRGIVEAVGLGGAYRLSESDRLRLARAFLAMLDVDPSRQSYFEPGQAPPGAGQDHNGFAVLPPAAAAL